MSENILPPHTFTKNGIYYYVRRVPSDLIQHFNVKKVSFSLRTRSLRTASQRAQIISSEMESLWFKQRASQLFELETDNWSRYKVLIKPTVENSETEDISVQEAVDMYIKLKGKGKSKSFVHTTERAFRYLTEVCGEKTLNGYQKSDATLFRDALVAKGLAGSSITRTFTTIRSVYNLAASETGFDIHNPFNGIYYDKHAGVVERKPIPVDAIRDIQGKCFEINDDIRWLVALVSDTGMRLAEAAGLGLEDFHLDEDVPFVRVQQHPWRRLKTKESRRDVPLVGAALWAAKRIVQNQTGQTHAFPRYNRTETTNANSASAALNKWLGTIVPDGCSMHSFRHSFRDRLRAVGCPEEIADELGGWSHKSIGSSYGSGHPIDIHASWMRCLAS